MIEFPNSIQKHKIIKLFKQMTLNHPRARVSRDHSRKNRASDYKNSPEIARTRGFAMALPRPNLPALFHMPVVLATLIDSTIFCLVLSIAFSQARRSSSSSALDFAISAVSIRVIAVWILNLC